MVFVPELESADLKLIELFTSWVDEASTSVKLSKPIRFVHNEIYKIDIDSGFMIANAGNLCLYAYEFCVPNTGLYGYILCMDFDFKVAGVYFPSTNKIFHPHL